MKTGHVTTCINVSALQVMRKCNSKNILHSILMLTAVVIRATSNQCCYEATEDRQ